MTKAAELAKWGEVTTNGQVSGRRNIIINGAMNVAQRSASVTGIGAADGYFTCDRWGVYQGSTAGRLTMTQTADGPSGFANCMKLDCTTADTSIAAGEFFILRQSLEGQDVQQLKYGTSDAEKITVSFYVKGNASAKYTCELQNNDNTRTIAQTFDVTTSWSRVVLTFNADTSQGFDDDNAISLTMLLWLHAGSNFTGGTFVSNTWADTVTNKRVGDSVTSFFDSTDRTFFITGVQMEVGSQATPFEHRSFGEELALCERYYEEGDMSIRSSVNTVARLAVQYRVEKRAVPTFLVYYDSNKTTDGVVNRGNSELTGCAESSTVNFGNWEKNTGGNTDSADFAWYWTASAEL